MTPEQFAYWLQGFAELTSGQLPTKEQWDSIVEHLNLVFDKKTQPVKVVTPTIPSEPTKPTFPADWVDKISHPWLHGINPPALTC